LNIRLYIDGVPEGEYISEDHITRSVKERPQKDHTYEYGTVRRDGKKEKPSKKWAQGKWK
jgi:hypothetical protein